ncbi:ABC-type dipeptide/oligopeptide/nickel transport system ATPase component [Pseudarthrobacter defluvii]|nr:ABC-type dipeptide/oligopeptide/nickel transport system ATPase component [Pseudarthrobacter defluvii]
MSEHPGSENLGSLSDQHIHDRKTVLDIDHLKVTFATDGGDVHAVKDVSLDVRAGEVLAIVGESGSGKTVTAKTILGLLPETAVSSGTVLINGANVISLSPGRLRQIRGRDVAMVFQEPSTALNPVFTVGWQIAEGIRAHAGANGGGTGIREGSQSAGHRGAGQGGHPRSRTPRQLLSAPVFGRAEAACSDCRGPGAKPRAHRGR